MNLRHTWLGKMLIRLRLMTNARRVPLFGIQAVGKTYFSYTVAHYLARHDLGHLDGDGMRALDTIVARMLARKPLDATAGNHDYNLHIHAVPYDDYLRMVEETAGQEVGLKDFIGTAGQDGEGMGRKVSAKLMLSTNDMSGSEFAMAVKQLAEPHADLAAQPFTAKFNRIIDNCDGCVVAIDLVRQHTPEPGREEEAFRSALAEQVVPVIRGVELAVSRRNLGNRRFPLFLVFTKADLHRLDRTRLYAIVHEVFALMLARVKGVVSLRIHAVASLGFGASEEGTDTLLGHQEGVGLFVADLVAQTDKM